MQHWVCVYIRVANMYICRHEAIKRLSCNAEHLEQYSQES